MGIRVAHEPSAKAVGMSAYAGGRGQRSERDAQRMAQYNIQKRAQDIQQEGQRLRFQSSSAMLGASRMQFETLREDRQQKYEDAPARSLEMGLVQQELLKKNVNYQYTESQKREMDKVQDGISWIRQQVAEGAWTPEQAEVAEQKLQMKRHGIIPAEIYDDSPPTQAVFESSMVTWPGTEMQGTIDKNGKFVPMPADPQIEIDNKKNSEKAKLLIKLLDIYDTPQEAREEVDRFFGDYVEPPPPSVPGSLVAAAREAGKSDEDIMRDVQIFAETGKLPETGKIDTVPESEKYLTYDEATPEQQEKALKGVMAREMKKRDPAKGRGFSGFQGIPGFPGSSEAELRTIQAFAGKPHKKATVEQMKERLRREPALFQKFLKERKESVPPQSIYEATEAEKKAMYKKYVAEVASGENYDSRDVFLAKLNTPEKILKYWKPPSKKKK